MAPDRYVVKTGHSDLSRHGGAGRVQRLEDADGHRSLAQTTASGMGAPDSSQAAITLAAPAVVQSAAQPCSAGATSPPSELTISVNACWRVVLSGLSALPAMNANRLRL